MIYKGNLAVVDATQQQFNLGSPNKSDAYKSGCGGILDVLTTLIAGYTPVRAFVHFGANNLQMHRY